MIYVYDHKDKKEYACCVVGTYVAKVPYPCPAIQAPLDDEPLNDEPVINES